MFIKIFFKNLSPSAAFENFALQNRALWCALLGKFANESSYGVLAECLEGKRVKGAVASSLRVKKLKVLLHLPRIYQPNHWKPITFLIKVKNLKPYLRKMHFLGFKNAIFFKSLPSLRVN